MVRPRDDQARGGFRRAERAERWSAAGSGTAEIVTTRRCDMPTCDQCGDFRAPRSRDRLNEYYWFCLDHVREYNATWNYYAGMSADEIEAHNRADVTWQRPTWPMGMRSGAAMRPGDVRGHGPHMRRGGIDGEAFDPARWHDPFDLFEEARAERERAAKAAAARPPAPEQEALAVMGLEPGVGAVELKARYKELVKRHHPDANGGDKTAEDRLKSINQAYSILKKSLMA
jgi:hypothetical protein